MDLNDRDQARKWRAQLDLAKMLSLCAILMSAWSSYRTFLFVKHDLQVTTSEVSYNTADGGLYMKIAFSNGGNRDAAVLRAEPALWTKDANSAHGASEKWMPLSNPVDSHIPVTLPLTPFIVKAGGVEVVTLSVTLDQAAAEAAAIQGTTYIGISVNTMASNGALYHLERPVTQLVLDSQGQIDKAEAVEPNTLNGFFGITVTPRGEQKPQKDNKPFVWADKHYLVESIADAGDCREAPTSRPCPSGVGAVGMGGQK